MKELNTTSDIEFLIVEFYKKVVADDLIGKFFTIVVNFNWDLHIPIMVSFWETVLFGKSSYKGNPMIKHIELNKLSKLEEVHFERWIKLWKETVNENFTGLKAAEAISKAETIAKLMQSKITQKIEISGK
ncbi:MAG: group III truncated hemoglobin [Ignavibacteria bacterium]|nr:group III truncated hemoglobin [Ignavibacteria bacterium]